MICLDALRSQRAPESLGALVEEIRGGGARSRHAAAAIPQLFKGAGESEFEARRIVETVALALQASLMERHALPEAADAFCASRLERNGGWAFGTLPPATACKPILERTRLT